MNQHHFTDHIYRSAEWLLGVAALLIPYIVIQQLF
jgi:hypothetical protein